MAKAKEILAERKKRTEEKQSLDGIAPLGKLPRKGKTEKADAKGKK